jgi:PAS domain S-box-containing protein
MQLSSQQEIQVLHVDDDPSITDLTGTFLEREDDRFAVEAATSADEGLEKVNDRPPDCVVSDYNMPKIDGIDFLQAVREEHPNLPFILFTGKGSEEIASDALTAGATDYIQKQSGAEQYELLANRIRNAVGQYRSKKRLSETRKEYTTIFENAQNALLLIDVEDGGFRYRRCNPRASELIGRDRTEVVGERPREALGPKNGAKVVGAYRKCIQQREPVTYTVTLDLPVGRGIRECEVAPVSSDGDIKKLVVEFRDVTEQHQRQRDLEKIETLFQHAQDSLFLIDVTDEFIIEQVNPAYEDETGVSASEIQGQTPEQLLNEEQARAVEAHYTECVKRQEPLQYTEELQFGSELSYWETKIAPVVLDGSVEYIVGATRDVTEHKERERELREEQRFIEQALDTLDDLFYVVDTDGTLQRWNSQLPELTGYTDDDLIGTQAVELFPEDEREAIADSIATTLADGQAKAEADLRTTGGERLPCEFASTRLTNEEGNVIGLVGVGRDLTERRQRERRFQALVEESKDNISVIDTDGVFQYQSPAVERILGYEPEETIGDTAWEYVHPDDRERLESTLEEWVATPGATEQVEYRARHADGSWRWLEANGNNQLENPAVEGYVVNSRDITDRKKRERKLEQTHSLMRNMEQLADVGAWEYDPEAETLVMTSGARLIHGIEPSVDLTPKEAFETFHPDDRDLLEDRFRNCLNTGEPYEMDARLTTPDGEQRWVTTHGERVTGREPGKVVRGYVQNITEQKEREQELKTQNKRLEEFASIVSHDLRNPLRVAEGRLELIRDECVSDYIDSVAQALDRMDALIEDLLTLAREGTRVDETESAGLANVAKNSWQTVNAEQATLETNTSRNVEADQSRLRQLFENLYRNAIEHGGDDVTVSVGVMDDGFYVADTGPGIPESEREDVFEAGYSTNENGTGFGLQIVEQIADAHGWEIRVTESEGGGARFEITGVENGA